MYGPLIRDARLAEPRIRIAVVLVLAAGLVGCGSRDASPGETAKPEQVILSTSGLSVGLPIEVGAIPAPAVDAATASGGRFVLSEQRGKLLLVNFWATWCAPCVRETPFLVELQGALRDSGLVVVGVSLDKDGFETVQPFLDRFAVDYPVILEDGLSEGFGGVYVLPSSFIVDRDGNVIRRINGLIDEDAVGREIRSLL